MEVDRVAVTNLGAGSTITVNNQCGEFNFKLWKLEDSRTNKEAIGQYNHNLLALFGARNWNNFKWKQNYTSNSQLKFFTIKIPGDKFLIDMKWWIDYKVTIKFTNFPYPAKANGKIDDEGFMGMSNIMYLKSNPLHQCTENIHLKINNRDLTSYPIQMLNQRLEYMRQDVIRDCCEFCPHRKPNTQTTYEDRSLGRSPMMNIGATYDGDYGNETVLGDIVLTGFDSDANMDVTGTYQTSIDEDEKYKPWKFCNGTMTFTIREPVMAEPLGYHACKGNNRTMNNITDIDLEYNFNNLRNMIQFNCAKLYQESSKRYLNEDESVVVDGIKGGDKNWWVHMIENSLEKIMEVEISDAELSFAIATPNTPPDEETRLPFVTDYLEYKRYETVSSDTVAVADIRNYPNKTYEITSDIYSLTQIPNAIYLWVGPSAQTLYGSNKRCTLPCNTYAQITHVEVDYENLSKLMHHYTERDLYLMAVRNGLEDRTYADWTRVKRTSYQIHKAYDNDDGFLDVADEHEFFGVGSVLRIIPGIDITTGGESAIVGGMRTSNNTIRFTVQYRPLNMFDDNIKYSLYVALENNGVVTITKGVCDMSLVNIETREQLYNATMAPAVGVSSMYGSGASGKLGKFFGKIGDFMKESKIASTAASFIPGPAGAIAGNALRNVGYSYGLDGDDDDDDDYDVERESTRMKGGRIIPPGSFTRNTKFKVF